MNNLKKYAGLLNEEAPKDHFLAYITPSERDMLVDAGGKKTPTESGIFAYPPQDNYTSSYDSSQNQSGRNENTSGAGGGSGYQGSDNSHSRFDVGSGYYGEPTTTTTTSNNNDDIDSTYTSTSFDVTPEPVEKNFFEKVVDFVKGGGIIGSVIKSIGGKLNPENKYEGITGEDGYGEGDYISTQGDWAASKGFVDKAEDYYELDLEEQQDIDKQMYDDGVRSQAFNDLYNDGDTSNLNNLTTTERNEINKIIPNLPYAIGGTAPQESMVNKYFNNMGNNLGVSSVYMNTYNDAKNKIAQSLNLTPNTQQYGYGNTFNDNYARSMTSANPFFDELTNQGLI
tara:strand:+ start:49 stop:1068 length:1020 start_codon:yes stop_codon:yes gene_type:complete